VIFTRVKYHQIPYSLNPVKMMDTVMRKRKIEKEREIYNDDNDGGDEVIMVGSVHYYHPLRRLIFLFSLSLYII